MSDPNLETLPLDNALVELACQPGWKNACCG